MFVLDGRGANGLAQSFLYLSGGVPLQVHTEPHTRTVAQLINSYGLHRLVHQAALLSILWTDIREMPIWSAILYVDRPSALSLRTSSRSITGLRLRFLYTPRSLALAMPSAWRLRMMLRSNSAKHPSSVVVV